MKSESIQIGMEDKKASENHILASLPTLAGTWGKCFCRSVADKSDGDGLEGKAEEGRRGKRNWVCTKKWRVLRMVTEWEEELLPAG